MSVTIRMAMNEENGPPKCGSFIAHCTLVFDDEAPQPQDVDAFQHNIHSAIARCCRVVHNELTRQRQADHVAA
jgi:hypothetical protein